MARPMFGMGGMGMGMGGGRDLNIFVVKFDATKEAEKNIGAGDPFYCEKCKVCLNKWSRLMHPEEYITRAKSLDK